MSNSNLFGAELTAVLELGKIAAELTGVQLTERHHTMIASRLQKRMAELKLSSLTQYVQFYYQNRFQENQKLISLLTTHHTYFFREYSHFEFLLNETIPALLPLIQSRPDKSLKIWAAACSRGQEVYSLAMFLDFHLKKFDPAIKFEILGTDIDSESIAIASNGVYLRSELKSAPLSLVADHWAKGSGDIEAYVKAKKTIRRFCSFNQANLLELKKGSEPVMKFDVVFCRNVFIYFNQEQIKSITTQFMDRLNPNGFLFVGISESLTSLGLAIKNCGPSVYRHQIRELTEKVLSKPIASVKKTPIRILCVDDSPAILTLLKKIFSENKEEFEVVGTAVNGLDAEKKLKELKPDVLTLDIHMPEQTGIEYLQKNFSPHHPPVIMVTSVAREDSGLAGKALTLGASDYVEKPALSNLAERGEELRTKVRCAVFSKGQSKSSLTLDRSFQIRRTKSIPTPESKLRVVFFSLSQRAQIKTLLNEWSGKQPASFLMVDGSSAILPSIAATMSQETGKKIQYVEKFPTHPVCDAIYLMDFYSTAAQLKVCTDRLKTSVIVYGDVSKRNAEYLLSLQGVHLVLEDLGEGKGTKTLMDVADDVVLSTSFTYLSEEFFCKPDHTEKKVS